MSKTISIFGSFLRWSLYPASWILLIFLNHLSFFGILEPRTAWAVLISLLVPAYIAVEWFFPYEPRWSMTKHSLLSDLKYILVNLPLLNGFNLLLAFFTISIFGDLQGPASSWHSVWQIASALLIFEAINYSLHRYMHEGRGRLGRFFWKFHAAHHLPERVYVVMHTVSHPFNLLFIQLVAIVLPIWLMGYDEKVVVLFLMINGLHGLISHFNVDVRAGWLNYIFVGTELHRYHHSADPQEAKNYGATLSIYDQLFGTFVYRPGMVPEQLGVADKENYPLYGDYLKVLKLPFAG